MVHESRSRISGWSRGEVKGSWTFIYFKFHTECFWEEEGQFKTFKKKQPLKTHDVFEADTGRKKRHVPWRNSFLPVPANSHTLIDPICGSGDYIVELIGHSSRAGDIGHTAGPIEFWCQDIIQHTPCVAYFKASRFDPTNLQEEGRKSQVLHKHTWKLSSMERCL